MTSDPLNTDTNSRHVDPASENGSSPNGPVTHMLDGQSNRLQHPHWGAAMEQVTKRAVANRVWILALGHAAVFTFALWTAFLLRFDFAVPESYMAVFWGVLPWVLLIKLAVFYMSGHYHGWWRYVTFSDLVALLQAAVISTLVIIVIDRFLLDDQIPRAVMILDGLVMVILLGGLRASTRMFREHVVSSFRQKNYCGALLIGADHASALLAHHIQVHPEIPYRIKGFLGIDGEKKGARLGGIPVMGGMEDLLQVAAKEQISEVLITAGILPGDQMRHLVEQCSHANVKLKIIPPAADRLRGNRFIPIRDVEINDLLRREPVQLDTKAIEALVDGCTVMVTGAGGSIGSEICRQLMRFRIARLVMVGRGENRIFAIERELRGLSPKTPLFPCIADITDQARVRQLFDRFRPEVVFHAAAHKHVPLMEANVGEAIKNNVFGTQRLADTANEFAVKAFVMISTDKAVHPTSVMGVTKQIAERYIHAMSQESSTRFMVVRFGNVLGSAGSVVPIFQEQIRRGGPITVTDPQMVRFFMTIPEASQLVLQAAAMGRGGEIFTLDMGQPVRIVDLAIDLIRLSGLPRNSIDIVFSGVRPGEKLYEELYFKDEELLPTAHPKVQIAYHRPYSLAEARGDIDQLAKLIEAPEKDIRGKLAAIVPEYGAMTQIAAKRTDTAPDAPLPTETIIRQ